MRAGCSGLGIMDGAMALNLRKTGFAPVVHDVRPDAAKPQLAAGVEIKVPAAEIQAVLQKDG